MMRSLRPRLNPIGACMFYRIVLSLIAALVLLASPLMANEEVQPERPDISEAIAASHNPSQLLRVANAAVTRDQPDIAIQAMERLVEIRPHHQGYALQLVALHAQINNLSQAFDRLYKLSEQGMAAELDAVPGLDAMRQYPLYGHIRDAMLEANDPVGNSTLAAVLQRDDFSASAVEVDGDRFFVASLRTGEVISLNADGQATPLVDAEAGRSLGSVAGIALDPGGEHLWLAVNDLPQHVGHNPEAQSAPMLVRIDFSGDVVRRVSLPEADVPGQLADLVVASDGTVYAVDQRHAAIYRAAADDEQAELIGSAPRLTSLRALVLADEEQKLIVADYALGLMTLDLSSMQPGLIAASETLNLGGIESLAISDRVLMAVQPGFSPERILRLELDESFSVVSRGVVQAKALPEFMYPMRGSISNGQFVFVANSYLPILGVGGEYPEGEERAGVKLMTVPIEAVQREGQDTPESLPPEMLRRR